MIQKVIIVWLWSTILTALTVGYTFADYDCILADSSASLEKYQSTSAVPWPFAKDDLNLARQHLAGFCNKISQGNKIQDASEWAESPYLFDQLIDLWFRKLDAYSDPSLRYWIKPDDSGVTRQKKITDFSSQFASTDTGKEPNKENTIGAFITDFSTYWPTNKAGASVDTNTCTIQNYSSLALYQKYIATCEIASCISDKAIVQDQTQTNSANSKTKIGTSLCDTITTNRFITEAAYAKQLITRVGIRAITSTLSSYSQNYFIWNRRQSLFDKITLFDQYMTFVNHKVEEWTPSCSK